MIELADNHTIIDKDELTDLYRCKIAYLEGRPRKEFTDEEKEYMLKGRAAGLTCGMMGKALGRNKSSVYGWLNEQD